MVTKSKTELISIIIWDIQKMLKYRFLTFNNLLQLLQPFLVHLFAGSVGATNMNEHSSRSHAIFTITIECSEKGIDGNQHVRMGKLHLVDLAVRSPSSRAEHCDVFVFVVKWRVVMYICCCPGIWEAGEDWCYWTAS